MADVPGAAHAARAYKQARRSPWANRLARIGLAGKGIVYILIGVLAIQVARGQRGQAAGAKGALQTVAQEPLGAVLVGLIGFALIGYVFWRVVQAISDPDGDGGGAKGLAKRAGKLASGLIYAGVSLFALQLVFGSARASGSDQATRTWTSRLLSMPMGEWWVYLIGAGIIVYGITQFYRAYNETFLKNLGTLQMSRTQQEWAARLGKSGSTARGLVFIVIGVFLVQAASHANASEARGLDGALNSLAKQPYGAWILGFVALGLAAYGVYMIVEARFRRIRT